MTRLVLEVVTHLSKVDKVSQPVWFVRARMLPFFVVLAMLLAMLLCVALCCSVRSVVALTMLRICVVCCALYRSGTVAH